LIVDNMETRKKILSLTENHLFKKTYSKGKCRVCEYAAIYVLKNYRRNETRIGITASKSRGNAVVRSRIRRVLRECVRPIYPEIKKGYLVVIVARQGVEKQKTTVVGPKIREMLIDLGLYEGAKK